MLEETLYNYLQTHTNAATLPKSQMDIAMQILEDLNIITVEDLFNYAKWEEVDIPNFFSCILAQIPGVKFREEPGSDDAAQLNVEEERVNIFDRFWESIGPRLSEKLSIVANRCGHTCLSRELIILCGNAQNESVVDQKLKQFIIEKLQALNATEANGGNDGLRSSNDFLSATPKKPSLTDLKISPRTMSSTPTITNAETNTTNSSVVKTDSFTISDDLTSSASSAIADTDIDTRPTLYTTTPTTTATTTTNVTNITSSDDAPSNSSPNNFTNNNTNGPANLSVNSPFVSPSKRHSRLELEADSIIAKVKQIFLTEIIDFEVSDQICGIIDEVKQYYEIPEVNPRRSSVVEQFMPKYGRDWKASVVGSRTAKKDSDQWTEYQVVLQTNRREYSHIVLPGHKLDIYRRYSEFEELYKTLSQTLGPKFQFQFPKKTTFQRFRTSTLEHRNQAFQEMLNFIATEKLLIVSPWMINFFDDAKRKKVS